MIESEIKSDYLTADNWPEARAIFDEGISSGIASLETQAPDWPTFDQHHLPHCRFIATIQQEMAGWAALTPVSYRKAYAGVAEVSVYVARKFHQNGVGSFLMDRLIRCSEQSGIWTLQSIVFPENEASLRLHKKFGFRIVGYREQIARNRDGNWQDTILLERRCRQIT